MFDSESTKALLETVDYVVSVSLFATMLVLSVLCLVMLVVAVANAFKDASEPTQLAVNEVSPMALA